MADGRHEHGLVIGKFYPLHKGHQLLIDAALRACERVTVCMTFRPDESIPAHLRYLWIRELFPAVRIVTLAPPTPYYPSECASAQDFYDTWKRLLLEQCDELPGIVFTSEDYGDEIAHYWGIEHVCVDKARRAVPVSATAIRKNPYAHRQYLDPIVRPYFVKTVAIDGPESCGKTTLAAQLARHYATVWQPEFAREWLGERHCVYDDMEPIAEGHLRERERYKCLADGVLFVDTSAVTTNVFSEKYYGRCPPRVEQILSLPENRDDLCLLLSADVPWVKDTSRDLGEPAVREEMYDRFENVLRERYGSRCVRISGTWQQRFEAAVAAVDALLRGRS